MMAAKLAKGIAMTIIKVCRREPRNSKTAKAANPVPINPEVTTLEMELRINCYSSKVDVSIVPSGITPEACSSANRFFTPSTTLTVLASGCF